MATWAPDDGLSAEVLARRETPAPSTSALAAAPLPAAPLPLLISTGLLPRDTRSAETDAVIDGATEFTAGAGATTESQAAAARAQPLRGPPPHFAVQQIADIARQLPDRPVEISLNPEELGRVRMTLAQGDGSISVGLAIERADTADLLRRHIDMLTKEFRDLGFSDISFNFTGGDARQNSGQDAQDEAGVNRLDPVADAPSQALARTELADGRIDIRL